MNMLRQATAGPSRRIHSLVLSDFTTQTTQLPPVIDRYVQRKLVADPSSTSIPNPFSTHRSTTTGSVHPRYISRRREKQLRFWFSPESLPPAPSTSTSTHFAHPLSSTELSWSAEASTKVKKTLYEGRKVQFKGHKHERDRPERQRETEERLAGMEKRIAEWKRNKAEAKNSAKPSLPF